MHTIVAANHPSWEDLKSVITINTTEVPHISIAKLNNKPIAK